MFGWFHRRKIEDLDELSNQANDCIRAGKWQDAERLCQRLRENFPEELDADDRMAQLYQAQQNYAKALPYAQAALDKARRHPEKFDPELVEDLSQQVAFLKQKALS
jgi:tetratricopeptide (TPR) repeat protein